MITRGSFAILLALSFAAPADSMPAREASLRSLLLIKSTDPVLMTCHDGWSQSCFRITLNIAASGATEVDVGHIPDNMLPKTIAARAIAGSGASCVENRGVGLPDVVVWSNGDYTWESSAFRVSQSRSGTMMFDFGCDGKLVSGDQLAIEFALAVDADGRSIRPVHFTLPPLALVSYARH
jgi:hypothetical protein